ncbi:MAG: 2'-5' RNA ligase family protein [Chloroflexi bacterium]|nr:2'-5' RNA ligase family protein [Chloroflexota bacterium]
MPQAVQCYFDGETEAHVRTIWEAMKAEGVSAVLVDGLYRPHFTLTVGDLIDIEHAVDKLREFAAQTGEFGVQLGYMGIFTPKDNGVVYIGLTPNHALLDFHTYFQNFFKDEYQAQWSYYLPGRWIPHCTCAFRLKPEQIPAAVAVCQQFVPSLILKPSHVYEIGMVEVPGAAEIVTTDLRG